LHRFTESSVVLFGGATEGQRIMYVAPAAHRIVMVCWLTTHQAQHDRALGLPATADQIDGDVGGQMSPSSCPACSSKLRRSCRSAHDHAGVLTPLEGYYYLATD